MLLVNRQPIPIDVCTAASMRIYAHQSIEYIRETCHNLLVLNGKESTLSISETLVNASLCHAKLPVYVTNISISEAKYFQNVKPYYISISEINIPRLQQK